MGRIFIPSKNIWTPQPIWGQPKYQKGMLRILAGILSAAAVAGTVTISGIGSFTENGAGTRDIRLRFNFGGTIDLYRTSTGYVQQNSSTDWISPISSADSSYDVRMASISAGAWNTAPAATGVWINLGASREWIISDANASPFIFETVSGCVFEIRKDGGAALASTTLPTTGGWTANRTS